MENKKESFNFQCYSFDALLGLDSVRGFLKKGYEKVVRSIEPPSKLYEKVSKNLEDMDKKSFILKNQIKMNSLKDLKAYETLWCDEQPEDEDVSWITQALHEAFDRLYSYERELEISEKMDEDLREMKELNKYQRKPLQERFNKDSENYYVPEKGFLKKRLLGYRYTGIDPEGFKTRVLSKHLSSAFWSNPFSKLLFQDN